MNNNNEHKKTTLWISSLYMLLLCVWI